MMKPSKDVCKRCQEERGWDWNIFEDTMWNFYGEKWCINKYKQETWVEKDKISDVCKYKFEHTVMGGSNGKIM